jgi:predicted MFS family arabinose efflux permease
LGREPHGSLIDMDVKLRQRAHWPPPFLTQGNDKLTDAMGGRARRKAVVLLASVLALSGADVGAISALAPQLESAFRVNNAGIGLLVTVSILVGALAAMPVGVLADRMNRTRLLSISILVWGATELVSAFSVSFLMLLLTRLALGAVTATAGPTVASLTGDLFPARDRSRIYGMILTGELLGAGLGVLIAGDIGAGVSWRVGMAILALPSLGLAWVIHRHFPEPARGGQSRFGEGAEEIVSAEAVEMHTDADVAKGQAPTMRDEVPAEEHPVLAMVDESELEPDQSVVRAADAEMSIWQAMRWVRRVPTNLSLIVASALGYFFLSGLRTFALIYARGRFGIGQGMATVLFLLIGLAAVAGVLASGKWTDRLIYRGLLDARLIVGGVAFLVAVLAFIPALLTGSMLIGLPLFLVAAFALAVPNPPVDAARLDVVPSRMWGRVESIRTTCRTVLEACAPLYSASCLPSWAGEAQAGSPRAWTRGTSISQSRPRWDWSTPSSSCSWLSSAPACSYSGLAAPISRTSLLRRQQSDRAETGHVRMGRPELRLPAA